MITHTYHHKYCQVCQKYCVHDSGKCCICMEQAAIIKKIEDTIPKPEKKD